ncbi:uncharacterized protein DUF2721 [Roseiarcus fermentans]|uniref:Uncharacterized protein DUF2721 n=1 Tax=Roseiarcus fermentans TaxID=1473586 RepID=A0A366FRX6_9HYPH|nr:DUF2721 domain-containing protein [Roseiarcus fermentans]RBP17307.1 uncharacterized protein DUF2721 [Roseiarcus fermentans]
MLDQISNMDRLSQVIAHAAAPAFLLGAVAGFLSILTSRLQRTADRTRAMTPVRIPGVGGDSSDDLAVLAERCRLLNRAIYLSVLSALSTAALLIVAFTFAALGLEHRVGVAVMFVLALLLLMGSLVMLTLEVRLAIRSLHLD